MTYQPKKSPSEPEITVINDTYGFTVNDREYSVYKRVLVDPTKAPTYKPEEGGPVPAPYEAWRAIGRYYPVNSVGVTAMLSYVAFRSAGDSGKYGSISEYISAIETELTRLTEAIAGKVSVRV
ncbi:hypothetical protein ACX93W_01610 [Paenibacillus sp. CAU 1782]